MRAAILSLAPGARGETPRGTESGEAPSRNPSAMKPDPDAVHDAKRGHVLAVVVPCFNVEAHIAGVIEGLPAWVAEIVAVDDCSTDGTLAVLRRLASEDPRLRVVARDRNGGVGAAMRSGYRAVLEGDADLVVKMDGDGQMDSAELPGLLRPLLEGRADYAKGNRFRHVKDLASMPRARLIGNVLLTFMTRLVSGYWRIFDAQNGYTAITRDALDALPLARLDPSYAFENSMLALLNVEGRPVADVAMPAVYGDERSSMRVTRVLFSFPPRLVGMLLRRLVLKYLVYDVSPIAVYAGFGSLLLGFATSFGGYHWWQSIRTGIPAATGTTVVALLTFLMGYMLLLQAVNLDIAQSPRLREPREELDLAAVPDRFSVRGGAPGAPRG